MKKHVIAVHPENGSFSFLECLHFKATADNPVAQSLTVLYPGYEPLQAEFQTTD